MASIIQDVVDMIGYMTDAALAFPTSVILLAVGFVLIAGSSLVLGYLALGAAIDFVVPDSVGQPPAQRQ